MYKKSLLRFLTVSLISVFAVSGLLFAQDMNQAKAEYEQVKIQIQDLISQMGSLQAGQADEYNALNADFEKLKVRKTELESIMSGDADTKKKIAGIGKLYNDGLTAYRIQRYSDALSKFNEAIANGIALNNPMVTDPIIKSFFGIGNVYYLQRNYTAMIEPLQKAIALDANNYGAYNLIGRSYDRQGNLPKAIESYQKSLEVNNTINNFLAHFNMGVTYYNMKEYTNAKRKFQNAYELNPRHSNSFLYLGMTHFELKEYNEAGNALDRATTLDEKSWRAHFFLARVYNGTGEYDNAITAADNTMKYHTRKTKFGGALIERGIAFENKGNNARALEDYNAALLDRVYKKNAEFQIEMLTKFGKKGGDK